MSATILIVEDEFAVARGIQYALQQEGYEVSVAKSGEEGLDLAVNQAPDLVVLDVRLPGIDGFEVLRRMRAAGSKAPVLVLTARDDEVDKVIGLELGADDYLTKPFDPQELVARAKALLRRARIEPDAPKLIRAGKLEVDLERHEVRHGQAKVQLRPKEFDLLALLSRHPGRVFQRSELLDLVWGYDFPGYTRTVDVHIQQLREKLAAAGVTDPSIQTVWGVGYRLEPAGS